jgi:hypothetical protein
LRQSCVSIYIVVVGIERPFFAFCPTQNTKRCPRLISVSTSLGSVRLKLINHHCAFALLRRSGGMKRQKKRSERQQEESSRPMFCGVRANLFCAHFRRTNIINWGVINTKLKLKSSHFSASRQIEKRWQGELGLASPRGLCQRHHSLKRTLRLFVNPNIIIICLKLRSGS